MPPHEPVYQFQFAPIPKFPPDMLSVVDTPLQIGEVPLAEVAAVDNVFTFMVILEHIVVLQNPSALNQYIVEIEGL